MSVGVGGPAPLLKREAAARQPDDLDLARVSGSCVS